MSNIGMMDAAFFVGRKELVDWVNDTLEINISKIEQTASGAMACQIFDIMHPGQVAMSKVNWAAKQDFEFVANYKILQTAFAKFHVDRFVDVDRLIKGKYQDNLEFMQWFKRFYELAVQDKGDYDCAGVRLRGKGGAEFNRDLGRAGGSSGAVVVASADSSTAVTGARQGRIATSGAKTAATKKAPATETAAVAAAPPATARTTSAPAASRQVATSRTAVPSASSNSQPTQTAEINELKATNEQLTVSLSELKMEMDGLEKERNFYFDKLRDIEMMLQDLEDNGKGTELTASIFKILYATADGFDRITEEGAQVNAEEDETYDAAVVEEEGGEEETY